MPVFLLILWAVGLCSAFLSRLLSFGASIEAMATRHPDEIADHRIDFLLSQVGELKGTTQSMIGTLNALTENLNRMQIDVNAKHQENLKFLQDHARDDDRRFDKVNRIIYAALGAVAILDIILRYIIR